MSNIWTKVFEQMKKITGAVDFQNNGTLQEQINSNAEVEFKKYYGLIATTTEFLSNGSIKTTNSEATVTTTFTTKDNVKTITEKIAVTATGKTYTKTTTITPASGSTNKKIMEVYS